MTANLLTVARRGAAGRRLGRAAQLTTLAPARRRQIDVSWEVVASSHMQANRAAFRRARVGSTASVPVPSTASSSKPAASRRLSADPWQRQRRHTAALAAECRAIRQVLAVWVAEAEAGRMGQRQRRDQLRARGHGHTASRHSSVDGTASMAPASSPGADGSWSTASRGHISLAVC